MTLGSRNLHTMDFSSVPTEAEVVQGQLLQLLRQTLRSKVDLVSCAAARRRHDYVVLIARLRHPSVEVVIKLAGPQAPVPCPFERTATIHRLVSARTAIPMPEVLAADESYQTCPWRYIIKVYVSGQEWGVVRRQMNAQELADAYQQIGSAVA